VNVLARQLERLAAVVGPSRFLTATDEVCAHSVEGQSPLAVVFPASAEEVAALLRVASEARLSVLLRGAGHHLYLGAPPEPIGVLVSLGRLSKLVAYDPEDLTVTLEAGMPLASLQRLVGEHNQVLPLDPPGPETATLGGIVSANLAGPMRMRYGSPRDLVLGLRVALANGEVIKTGGRTVKNVAGYDLSKLFVGALGSIGAITEVTLRLTPRPQARAMLIASLPPPEAAATAARLVGSRLEITACEIANPAAAQRLGELPAAPAAADHLLIVGLLGEPNSIARQEREIRGWLRADCARLDDLEAARLWQRLRALAYPQAAGAVLARIAVPLSQTPAMFAAACEHRWPAVARAGDGTVYASPSPECELSEARGVVGALREQAERVGGHLVIESGPTALKRALPAWGAVANADLMAALKRAYDPQQVLGCGRLLSQ
jgi:glycolate oxidase FAD binding subunit